ncbi:polysaccharide pyruvyl transferase family protein [Amycolatopsis umgeniensis]|uniref:Polysaccharide pyruvyl transferase WcaK-like protein n=1 Tax=Amycolatopsis umgeniensis TaxID=336628 RepID=A0A841B0N9_9PSEU|nr:polysaccharide pyruvyl transferase family protein [Amycolatopsis umgeniensis]MBB5854709.1 polysaccharide pyruvyl transferase WcaK-like protein [Amycolatopsis umgeniensis]
MTSPARIGLFGLLGSGNLGNDGSFEAVLGYLRAEHPGAAISVMCGGPEIVASRYDLETTALNWYQGEYRTASGPLSIAMKGFGKLVDIVRTVAWARRQDVVIVPGMGVLESTLPLRPWGFPYALLLLSASGRMVGTKVALVSVGANVSTHRVTRSVIGWAARLATFRSYRDEPSREAMRAMGVDVTNDRVYPDLAFALPAPSEPVVPRSVGVGVMAYHGGNDDRARANDIYESYVDNMTRFVARLVADGRPVRLFIGDRADRQVVDEIMRELESPLITAADTATLDDVLRAMSAVETVVATRYHNVLCALKLAKPTLSIGYAGKNEVLMTTLGLGEFCQSAKEIDFDSLVRQFAELETRAGELAGTLAKRGAEQVRLLDEQFSELSAAFLPLGVR